MRIRTKLVMGIGAASALSVGLVGGLAAQSGESPEGEADGEGRRCGGGSHQARGERLNAVADLLGVEPGEIQSTLSQGGTLADVAAEAGVDPQVLVDTFVAEHSARLAQAVTDGRIDQAQADEALANATQRAETFINEGPQGDGPRDGERRHRRQHDGPRRIIGAVAGILGVEPQDVVEALRGGTSIADYAESLGVGEQELTNSILAEASARLAEAVANGRITQDEADTKLAEMAERLSEALNKVPEGAESASTSTTL